jgi:hypothetical protein
LSESKTIPICLGIVPSKEAKNSKSPGLCKPKWVRTPYWSKKSLQKRIPSGRIGIPNCSSNRLKAVTTNPEQSNRSVAGRRELSEGVT